MLEEQEAVSQGVMRVEMIRIEAPEGIVFIRNNYGNAHIIVRKNELTAPLASLDKLAVASYTDYETYSKQLELIAGEKTFDHDAFLKQHELKTQDSGNRRVYDHKLIDAPWRYMSGDEQETFYYIMVGYTAFEQPLVYINGEFEEFKNPSADETVVSLGDALKLTAGVEVVAITKKAAGSVGLSDLRLRINKDELPVILQESTYYAAILNGEQPFNLAEDGVPRNILRTQNLLYSTSFGGSGNYDYVAIVIYDERATIIAYYESDKIEVPASLNALNY